MAEEAYTLAATVIPSAFLRVFQPLDAFPPDEQRQWERYLVDRGPDLPAAARYRQRSPGGWLGLLAREGREHADVRVADGVTYLCPWGVRLRLLAGILAVRESSPAELADGFVTESEARRAAREISKLRRRNPRVVPFVMQSPWHVPPRWFALFEDGERRLDRSPADDDRLRYLTTVPKAIGRAERFVPPLRRAELDSIADHLTDLARWLAVFDRRSLLELDYDGLCDLMTWDELDDDHSAREMQGALEALASSEFPRSADLYQGVLGRWADLKHRDSLN